MYCSIFYVWKGLGRDKSRSTKVAGGMINYKCPGNPWQWLSQGRGLVEVGMREWVEPFRGRIGHNYWMEGLDWMRMMKKVSRITPQCWAQETGLLRLVTLKEDLIGGGRDHHSGTFRGDYETPKWRYRKGIWVHIFEPLKLSVWRL